MPTDFPTSLDGTNLPNPSNSYYLSGKDLASTPHATYSHSYQHGMVTSALVALQTKIGITGSTDRTSLVWKGKHYPLPADSANSMDDEFDAGTLDGKWTKQNELISGGNQVYYVIDKSHLTIRAFSPYNPGEYTRGLTQAVPSGDWTFEICVSTYGDNFAYRYAGFVLADSTFNKVELVGILTTGSPDKFFHSVSTKFTANTYNGHYVIFNISKNKMYFRLSRVGTTIYTYFSYDGLYFLEMENHSQTAHMASFDLIGISMTSTNSTGSYSSGASFDYFRRIA